MKRIFFLMLCFCTWLSIEAQDIIIFTNGDEIEAKVVEVSDTEVKYKTWSNQDGPTWVKKTTDIFMIRYENGSKQTFTTTPPQTQQQAIPQQHVETPKPQQPTITPQQNDKTSIPVSAHFIVGADARWGGIFAPFVLSQPGTTAKEDHIMTRWPFSFDAYVDFFPQKTVHLSNSDEYFDITGFGLGVAYVNRGGKFEFVSDYIGTEYLEKSQIKLSYIALRPALAGHHITRKNKETLFHFGFEIGIPQKATITLKDRGIENADITDEPYFLTDCSYGAFMEVRSLNKVVDVGFYMEFTWNLFDKFFVPNINAKSYCLAGGITLGWSPKAIMLKNK